MTEPMLEANGVEAGYGDLQILRGVSIAVRPHSVVSVIGPNGAGKSTLLKALYGLVSVSAGQIVYRDGDDVHDLRRLSTHRITERGLNYVPQLDNIFPSMSIAENLEIGGYLDRRGLAGRLERIYATFPELRDRRRQRAGSLSGGQRQMLAIARALVSEPRLLLLDEPSAGLAPAAVDALFAKLREIRAGGVALLIVEQNARRSLAMSDYGYVLETGRNAHAGTGRDLLDDERVVDLYLGGGRRAGTLGEH